MTNAAHRVRALALLGVVGTGDSAGLPEFGFPRPRSKWVLSSRWVLRTESFLSH